MKTLPVLFLLLLLSCNNKMSKGNLSGSYARAFQSEYAVGTDTLLLSKASDDNTYRIRKVSGYYRIKDGVRTDSMEFHEEHWLGVYDKGHDVIRVLPSGKVISVDLDKQEILLGSSVYKQIE